MKARPFTARVAAFGDGDRTIVAPPRPNSSVSAPRRAEIELLFLGVRYYQFAVRILFEHHRRLQFGGFLFRLGLSRNVRQCERLVFSRFAFASATASL